MANATATRTQHRATCPHCFAQQAIRKTGRLVPHGYTRPQQWHSNEGTCHGAGAPNFGTPAGRDYTAQLAERALRSATLADETAKEVLLGTAPVMTMKRLATRLQMEVVKENADELDRERYAGTLRLRAKNMRAGAAELRAMVAAWQPVAPVAVTVAKSTGPLVHLRGSYYSKSAKACAASAMAAQKWAPTTDVLAEVTCDRCKAQAARRAAKVVA